MKKKGLDGKRIEEILGMSLLTALPDQEAIVKASLNEGVPFIMSQPRSPIAKALMGVTEMLLNHDEEVQQPRKKEKRGFLLKR